MGPVPGPVPMLGGEGSEDLYSGLAHALGLPEKSTVMPRSAIRAADTDGTGELSYSSDVAGVSPVPVQKWRGEPSPCADVAG